MHILRLGGPLRTLLRDGNTAPRGAEPCLQVYTPAREEAPDARCLHLEHTCVECMRMR